MRYTFDLIIVSIGINIDIFVYSYIIFVYVCFQLVSSIGTHFFSYTYTCFIYASLTLSVGYHVDFLFHEKQFCFIPYLKDFVLVNKFFI